MSFSTVVSFSFTVYICVNKERQCLVYASPFCGLVVSLLKRWTCDSKGLGFDSRSFCFHVTTLSKLFTHVYTGGGTYSADTAIAVPLFSSRRKSSSRNDEYVSLVPIPLIRNASRPTFSGQCDGVTETDYSDI